MIFDFHAHLRRNAQSHQYEIEEQLEDMRANHIAYRVLSTFEGASMASANDAVIALHRQYPQIIPCAVINPKQDEAVAETRRVLSDHQVRLIEMDSLECGFLPEKLESTINAILVVCAQHQAVVKIFTGSTHRGAPDQWLKYFRRFPQLTFVLLHMGAGDFQYGTVDLCQEVPNLMLETSVACEAPALQKALRVLAPERFLFGSDFPEYFTELEVMKLNYYGLTKTQLQNIYAENARRLLPDLFEDAKAVNVCG